jgi:hypothetical protein
MQMTTTKAEAEMHSEVAKTPDKVLMWVLRLLSVILMTAIVPAVMPSAWMEEIPIRLGMGELPRGPMIAYLTHSLSAMCTLHGAVVFVVSLDVRRYLPIVKCLAVLAILFGIGMIVLDVMVGMPTFWVLCEGPFIVVVNVVLLWLAGRVARLETETK